MAPRKDASDAQQAAGIDSFELPKALVTRLAKSALPPEAKLQKDTVTALVRGATVFINYLSATAQDIAAARSRRSIASADVLAALEVLALGDLVPLLERELETYRGEKGSKNKAAGDVKVKSKEVPRDASAADAQEQGNDSGENDEDDVPEGNEEEPEPEPQNDEEVEEDPPLDDEEHFGDVPSDAEMPDVEPASDHAEDEEGVIEDRAALETEELLRDARGLENGDAGADLDQERTVL